jgi:hypothetical protein
MDGWCGGGRPGSAQIQVRQRGNGQPPAATEGKRNDRGGKRLFRAHGRFGAWSLASSAVHLNAGSNKIRLTTIGSNGPNVDHLSVNSSLKHVLYLVDNGFNKLVFLNQKDPSKNWTVAIPGGSRDLQLVANNKVLVSHGNGAAEYDRTTGARGWSVSTYAGVSTAQRLSNGNTLLGWSTAASGTRPPK